MKSLINDNWEKMSIILDREIPQKENRRRMFIFWWSIAAGLAIPIIFMITLKFSNFKSFLSFVIKILQFTLEVL